MRDVEYSAAFGAWFDALSEVDQDRVAAAVEILQELGPGLGRPFVDRIAASRHHHLKERRPRGGHLRVLFAFDPRRVAVLLVGGDKRGRWNDWYPDAVAQADAIYDEHLDELKRGRR